MSPSERQRKLAPKIAQVSADPSLAKSREEILRIAGYDVQTFLTPSQLVQACKKESFDLLIIGHSLEYAGREQMSAAFRKHNADSPILQLELVDGIPSTSDHVFNVYRGPEPLLALIDEILLAQRRRRALVRTTGIPARFGLGSDTER